VPLPFRRSDYDVTDTVQVSSVAAVREAVLSLYAGTWPGEPVERLSRAVGDFERLFNGEMTGYAGVDTVYHDLQHSLDMVLAMARLVSGYERSHGESTRFGAERGLMAMVTALFHDSGYIREASEGAVANGAVFTRNHVTRSARFLARYLPTLGLGHWVPTATAIVHFTGYEVPFDQIRVDDMRDRKVGHLLGTADLLAQMADRCYLEKCRDRLYAEFVLGGIAVQPGPNGMTVLYGSGLDLLRRTPDFVRDALEERLEGEFEHAYRYVEPLFAGQNPYMQAIRQNIAFLKQLMRSSRWPMLRRNPPVYTVEAEAMRSVRSLMAAHLTRVWSDPAAATAAG
jgi:hypothetical protein